MFKCHIWLPKDITFLGQVIYQNHQHQATTHGPSFEPLSPPRQPSPQVTTVPYLRGFVISLFSNIAVMSYEISQSKFPIIVDLMPTTIKHGLVENPPFSSMINPPVSLFRRDATHCHLIAGGQRYCINSKTGSNICRRVAFLNMADPKWASWPLTKDINMWPIMFFGYPSRKDVTRTEKMRIRMTMSALCFLRKVVSQVILVGLYTPFTNSLFITIYYILYLFIYIYIQT